MQPLRFVCLIVLCLILLPVGVRAETPSKLVKAGNAAYQAGQYDEALKAYDEAAVEAPESPQIYFNKGTAYYQKQDYAKAKAAWEKAALTSKDTILEAKAYFNLGNNAFQEAKRQQDSDLQKAIEACTQSIGYYQQAVDLLHDQNKTTENALKKEASENLEMVRLVMKSILDEIAKQQEQAKQQQQAANDIKKLIEKQQELINQNQQVADEKKHSKDTEQFADKTAQLASDQEQLKKETIETAEKLPKPNPQQPDPLEAAKNHLDQARDQQESAVEKINNTQLDDAKKNQEDALKELKNALNSMEKSNGQCSQDPKKQSSEDPENGPPPTDENNPAQPPDNKEKDQKEIDQENQDRAAAQQAETAEDILNEEKKNQKKRLPAVSRRYREIDKDW